VFWAALLVAGGILPSWTTSRRLSPEAQRILELDRQVPVNGKRQRPVVAVILVGLMLTTCLFVISTPGPPSGSTRMAREEELFRLGADSCTPLLGQRIIIGGAGTRSCTQRDLTEVRTRTTRCSDGTEMLTAGSGVSLIHGRVGETWQLGPAPMC
jgi:hypothetical protein